MRRLFLLKYIALPLFILLLSTVSSADLFRKHRRNLPPSENTLPNVVIDKSEEDEQVKEARKQWVIASYKDEIEKMERNRQIVSNVNRIGYIVFVVAHILLVLAVVAAFQEFIRAAKTSKKKADHQELKVSMEGIALRSSLHGVILLIVAILFYFLFLKFVLPLDSSQEATTAPTEVSNPTKEAPMMSVPSGTR